MNRAFTIFLLLIISTTLLYSQTKEEDHVFLAPVKEQGRWGYINTNGKYLVNPKFEFANDFSENLAAVKINGRWGYIDGTGKYLIKPKFEDAYNFVGKLARVKLGEKWGYIDKQGNYIIEPTFEYANDFSEGLALVLFNGKYGYINTAGAYAITPSYEDAFDFSEGMALVYNDGRWGYVNKNHRLTTLPACEEVSPFFSDGLSVVESMNGRFGFLNDKGQYAIEPQFQKAQHFSEGLAAVAKNGLFGYINTHGHIVIQPQFEYASYFSQDRFAAVKINGKYGYINTRGELKIKAQFDEAKPFDNGIAQVVVNNRYGFINSRGNYIVAPEYNWASDYSEKYATIEWKGQYGFINTAGVQIIDPQFDAAGAFKKVVLNKSMTTPSITMLNPLEDKIETDKSNFTLRATIRSNEPVIDYLVFVNNQLLEIEAGMKGTRIKAINKTNSDKQSISLTTNIPLEIGENEIVIRATNTNGSTNSIPKIITYKPLQDVDKPDLYIVSVGISKYMHTQYNLNYADNDAEDFTRVFEEQQNLHDSKRLFKHIYVKTLTNEKATKANIQRTILNTKRVAEKDDLFILHISSHGEMDNNGDFYIRTYDTDPGLDFLSVNGLSNRWLVEEIRDFDCTVIQFFDACHSGSGGSDIVMKGRANALDTETAVRELRQALQSKAVYFFASSSQQEMSQERKEWKNGAFTEAVLACFAEKEYATLQGNQPIIADLNQDGYINTDELSSYVSKVVKVVTNGQQHPKATIENGEPINLYVLD